MCKLKGEYEPNFEYLLLCDRKQNFLTSLYQRETFTRVLILKIINIYSIHCPICGYKKIHGMGHLLTWDIFLQNWADPPIGEVGGKRWKNGAAARWGIDGLVSRTAAAIYCVSQAGEELPLLPSPIEVGGELPWLQLSGLAGA